jgi:hypothetical protein
LKRRDRPMHGRQYRGRRQSRTLGRTNAEPANRAIAGRGNDPPKIPRQSADEALGNGSDLRRLGSGGRRSDGRLIGAESRRHHHHRQNPSASRNHEKSMHPLFCPIKRARQGSCIIGASPRRLPAVYRRWFVACCSADCRPRLRKIRKLSSHSALNLRSHGRKSADIFG